MSDAKKILLKNKTGELLYPQTNAEHVLTTNAEGVESTLDVEIIALRSRINGLLAASDAMVFKGVLDAAHGLPGENYRTGWTFRIGLAGIYAGQACEVGDMLICVADYANAPKDTDWQAIQTNIDGAVTGPASATGGNLAGFDGATGKLIKDSEISMSDAADAVAKKHEHTNADVVNALSKNENGVLLLDGQLVNDGQVDCAIINAGESIPANLRDGGIIFEIQTA